MIEEFRLIEYMKNKRLEASNQGVCLTEKSNYIGRIAVDMKTTKMLSSGHLPILPLKPVGRLVESIQRAEGLTKSKANIHMVNLGKFPIGILVSANENYEFQLDSEGQSLHVDGQQLALLEKNERNIMESLNILRSGEVLQPAYVGLVGRLNAHNVSLRPKNPTEYCFINIAFRDYFSC